MAFPCPCAGPLRSQTCILGHTTFLVRCEPLYCWRRRWSRPSRTPLGEGPSLRPWRRLQRRLGPDSGKAVGLWASMTVREGGSSQHWVLSLYPLGHDERSILTLQTRASYFANFVRKTWLFSSKSLFWSLSLFFGSFFIHFSRCFAHPFIHWPLLNPERKYKEYESIL